MPYGVATSEADIIRIAFDASPIIGLANNNVGRELYNAKGDSETRLFTEKVVLVHREH